MRRLVLAAATLCAVAGVALWSAADRSPAPPPRTSLTIAAAPGRAPAVSRELARLGAPVTVRVGSLLQVRDAPGLEARLRRVPGITGVGPAAVAHARPGHLPGRRAHRRGRAASRGLNGAGIRIAIVDLGFGDSWRSLLGKELPPLTQIDAIHVVRPHQRQARHRGPLERRRADRARRERRAGRLGHRARRALHVRQLPHAAGALAGRRLARQRARRQAARRHRGALELLPGRAVRRHRRGGAGRSIARTTPASSGPTRPATTRSATGRASSAIADNDGWADIGPVGARLPVVPADRRHRHGRDALLEQLHAGTASRVAATSATLRARRHGHRPEPRPSCTRRARRTPRSRPASSASCRPRAGPTACASSSCTPTVVCDLEIFGGGVELGDEATLASSIPTPGDARGLVHRRRARLAGRRRGRLLLAGPDRGRAPEARCRRARLDRRLGRASRWSAPPRRPPRGRRGRPAHAARPGSRPAERSRHDRAAADRERPRHRSARAGRGHRRRPHPARRRSARVDLDGAAPPGSRSATPRASTSPSTTPAPRGLGRLDRRRRRRRRSPAPCTCASTRGPLAARPAHAPCSGRATWPEPLRAAGRVRPRRNAAGSSSCRRTGAAARHRRRATPSRAPASRVRRSTIRAERQHVERTLPLHVRQGTARARIAAPPLARRRLSVRVAGVRRGRSPLGRRDRRR